MHTQKVKAVKEETFSLVVIIMDSNTTDRLIVLKGGVGLGTCSEANFEA